MMHAFRQTTVILIDADATPRDALVTADVLALRFNAEVVTVSSINHEYDRPGHITVDAHPQAVDMAILSMLNRKRPYVVVTQDYGLAALALGQGALAISPKGLIYTNDNMDRLLMERDISARERRRTGRTRGPAARTTADADRFSAALESLLQSCTSDPCD